MKAFRQMNGNNDIYLVDGATRMELALATDKNAYAYIIGDAIRTVRGEIQLDTDIGIPYFDTVFDRTQKINIWKHYVEKKILSYNFVTGISDFNVNILDDGEVLSYDMIVETVDGEVSVTSVDPVGTGGGGGGGCDMCGLIQNGIFYMPVALRDGVQIYRQLKEYNLDGAVTTELSEETYIKNSEGIFVLDGGI